MKRQFQVLPFAAERRGGSSQSIEQASKKRKENWEGHTHRHRLFFPFRSSSPTFFGFGIVGSPSPSHSTFLLPRYIHSALVMDDPTGILQEYTNAYNGQNKNELLFKNVEEKVILKSRLLENTCRFSSTKCIARIVAVLGPSAFKATERGPPICGKCHSRSIDRRRKGTVSLSRAKISQERLYLPSPPLPSASSQIRLTAAGQDLRVRVRLTNPQSARNHRHHPPLLFFFVSPDAELQLSLRPVTAEGSQKYVPPILCNVCSGECSSPLRRKKSLHLPFFPPSFFRK